MKKLFFIMIPLVFLSGCITLKIDKDSQPCVDFGTPIIGHYRNQKTIKAVLYTVFFVSSLVGIILFAPSQPSPDGEIKSILNIPRQVSDPVFYSFIGTTAGTFTASSIDACATYHIVNKKIIDLNDIDWNPEMKKLKHIAIIEYRENLEQIELEKEQELHKEDILYYREKLLKGTISEEEMFFIEKTPFLKQALEKELGYYYINKELKQKQNE